jgi:hypothetical protein
VVSSGETTLSREEVVVHSRVPVRTRKGMVLESRNKNFSGTRRLDRWVPISFETKSTIL